MNEENEKYKNTLLSRKGRSHIYEQRDVLHVQYLFDLSLRVKNPWVRWKARWCRKPSTTEVSWSLEMGRDN